MAGVTEIAILSIILSSELIRSEESILSDCLSSVEAAI